jgi:hypothetical protein
MVILRGRRFGNDVPMPIADPARAIALKNDAIALMENWDFELATEKLTELEKLVPDEPLVRRNRAIAAVLAISPAAIDKARDREAYERGLARATAAVETLLKAEPELPIVHLLAARLAEHHEDQSAVVEHLEQAARLSHGDAAFEAEVYLASQIGQDPALQARGVAALKRAARSNPDNLWVLSELMLAQVVAKEPEAKDSLTRMRDLSRPFAEFIQRHYRVDIVDLLDKSLAAVEQTDWPAATRHVRIVANLLRPEIATKLDLKKVLKHPLEYVVADFSPEWHKRHADALKSVESVVAAPIEVTFVEADGFDQLPPLAGIRDVKIADFDLDGRWDVIVLLNGQVIVFGQPGGSSQLEAGNTQDDGKPASRWTTLCEAVVPSGLTKLVAADLDRDTENTPEDHRFIGQRTARADEAPDETLGAVEMVEDADIDLLVYGEEGIVFLRNDYAAATKTRSLTTLSQEPAFEALRDVLAIAPADIDHDGDLDLVVSTATGLSIWQNNDSREHTKFADISSRSALPPAALKATVLLPVDWNFDVQTDVLVTGPDVAKPGWLENISHGRLRWHAWSESELHLENSVSLHLVSVLTQPLKWDLLGLRGTEHRGLRLFDFNNDGQRDWLVWQRDAISVQEFVAKPGDAGSPLTKFPLAGVATCEVADFDADGDEDVLVVTDQRPIWIRNDGGNQNGWLDISIRADKDRKPQRDAERANIHGVGSWLELRGTELPELPGRKPHVRIVEGQATHFGLGKAKQVDAARIVWTNGVPQNILHPKSGQAIAAQQFLKGSCPYLYTWDGEQWVFFTDCLWAAPLGLQLAEGVTAPCREWEYLKLDGDRLQETNGEYRLMLTEELWEAAYFDQVRLLAVDHPADVEFFSNEKVGPPSISEFQLHPVRKRHTPLAARDHRGRDVLERLAHRDEKYLRAFDKVIQQGLTEEHFIELDLGDLSHAKNVTLFLTGWIFPTDTSINVSLSQNPDRSLPKPPSIWVPIAEEGEKERGGDKETKWREAIPYIGFPGGKTKTIAVDVTEALGLVPAPLPPGEGGRRPGEGPAAERLPNADQPANDVNSELAPSPQPSPKGRGSESPAPRPAPLSRRLRIVTSMELYWDEMFFTVDEPPLDHTLTPLPLVAADLQFRGFSARLPHPEFGPERYDASQITREPQWPPMGGRFTRYGDVTELLAEADDRLVILGAGDAVMIRFDATKLPKLPAGWTRDFILHNVGYDKDADLNTIYGQFVEPLPFRAMRGYPDPTGAEFPDGPIHRADQQRFHTREQNRRAFWIAN